jgi:hypothetical protein
VIVSVDVDQIAAAARLEAERHPARSPERRAAAHLFVALSIPPARSLAAARRAVLSFGDETTQSDALELLGRLAREMAPTEGTAVP